MRFGRQERALPQPWQLEVPSRHRPSRCSLPEPDLHGSCLCGPQRRWFVGFPGDLHGGPNTCFLNNGQGRFTNVTAAAGLISRLGSTSMALADIDGNGTLDLYVANYGATSIL
ncbi:MAG: VCBS repeat-containing protein [Pedosphaera sp.]|nr:VCBS repeat-containing protein [Pedosphaera sp.]